MRTLDIVATVLILIGALNWGLVGLFRFDLVAAIFGTMSVLSRIIYTLVGLAAVYYIIEWSVMPARWGRGPAPGLGRQAPQV